MIDSTEVSNAWTECCDGVVGAGMLRADGIAVVCCYVEVDGDERVVVLCVDIVGVVTQLM